MSKESGNEARERRAKRLGIAAAVAAMVAAGLMIRWPAPGISAVLGFVVYGLARGASRSEGDGA